MTISIPLSKTGKHAGKYEAIIDDCDSDLVGQFDWHVGINKTSNYARSYGGDSKPRKMIHMHRIIFESMTGITLEQNQDVDHIDGDGLNNQRHNLRRATRSQNSMNRKGSVNGTSKYKGVSFETQTRKWRAQISFNKKSIKLGRFNTEEEASEAYQRKAKEIYGEFARFD